MDVLNVKKQLWELSGGTCEGEWGCYVTFWRVKEIKNKKG